MREIKFRAWQKDYGGYMFYSHKSKGLGYLEFNSDSSTVIGEDDGDQRYEASKMPLMQYTGLKDKNGVEIYEGDLLLDKSQTGVDLIPKKVIWSDHRPRNGWIAPFVKPHWAHDLQPINLGLAIDSGYEIIGNIYQNPELLK